jgi:hypothetical protein
MASVPEARIHLRIVEGPPLEGRLEAELVKIAPALGAFRGALIEAGFTPTGAEMMAQEYLRCLLQQ